MTNQLFNLRALFLVAGSLIGPWLAIEWPILGFLLGVWEVSGGLSDSKYFLGCMMCKQLITIKFGTFLISLFPFPELLRLVKMCNILGCLYGVSKVFGRHLGSVWVTLDTVRGGTMCKHLFHSFSPADSFSASCLKLYKMGHILGCPEGVWRVSWRCLGIIWVTLDTVWRVMLSAQLKKKSFWVILISCDIFSQWPIFGDLGPKMRNFKSDFTSEGVLK